MLHFPYLAGVFGGSALEQIGEHRAGAQKLDVDPSPHLLGSQTLKISL